MLTENGLQAIQKRLENATPGPWRIWQNPYNADDVAVETAWCHFGIEGDTELITDYLPTDADAEFIAHAPEDIAALLAEVERLRARIEKVRELHKPIDALNTSVNQIQQVCIGCGQDDGNWQRWPCPTIRALDGEAE